MTKSVLNKKISTCRRADEPDRIAEVSLLDVLQTDKYRPISDTCSQIPDKKERQLFKLKHVPVITVSGTFRNRRNENNLVQHSGLICLDLDGVQEIDTLKQKVSALPFVAYVGRSISGTGLFAIVPIPISSPEEHKQRYAALEAYFIKHFGITGTIDPQPKNVAAARYVSYDPDAYYNHDAATFNELPKNNIPTKELVTRISRNLSYSDYEKVWDMVDQIQDRQLDFAPDYADYLRVAFSLANGLGENGRDAFHAVCGYSSKYNYKDADKQYSEALKNGKKVTLGTFFGMCKDYGLMETKDELPVYIPNKKITPKVPAKSSTKEPYPAWLSEAKKLLHRFRSGEFIQEQYNNFMADVCIKYKVSPEALVKAVNNYVDSLN